MQRAPRIINLYDKPLYPRRYMQRSETPSLGTVLLSCLVITLATVGFFWSYDAIAHRDGLYLPSSARVAVGDRRLVPATEALVPDMNAPEVVRANADVPPSAVQKNDARKDIAHTAAESPAAAPPKKKTHAVRRISPEARESYASAPAFPGFARMDGW
jgi:hypothetical protein